MDHGEKYWEGFSSTSDITSDMADHDNGSSHAKSPWLARAVTVTAAMSTNKNEICTSTPHKPGENKYGKIKSRVVYGVCMFGVFATSVYLGHLYACLLVALVELMLFRELVGVRYHSNLDTIEHQIPLFRTTQWMWFCLAIFYTYGDFMHDMIQSNVQLHPYLRFMQYFGSLSFMMYSATLVVTITTLQKSHIRFQINQLCWTVWVLCLTVGQLRYVMHNIFNGLFWFVFPSCLVFCNDIMAWACGITCGRKFIHRQFLSISPNKTWEGFIGGAFFTIVAGWYISRWLAHFHWMTCPTNEFRLAPPWTLQCELHPIFQEAQSIVPQQMLELWPRHMVKAVPGVVEICKHQDSGLLERCISGEELHVHHHFELILKNIYPIQVHAIWLSLFASLVAPFGGFLASAIKRAYGLKDFDSWIPGHGGVMDRMDCQFLMALCTWVHYNTFVKLATISVPKLVYMYSLLSESQQREFLATLVDGQGAASQASGKLLKKILSR